MWLAAAIVTAICAVVVGALLVPAPADGPPAYALDALLVWRVEVAVAVAAALYGAIVVVLLALRGMTLTRVGLDGVDIPPLDGGRGAEERRALRARIDAIESTVTAAIGDAQRSTGTLHQMKDQTLRGKDGGR